MKKGFEKVKMCEFVMIKFNPYLIYFEYNITCRRQSKQYVFIDLKNRTLK